MMFYFLPLSKTTHTMDEEKYLETFIEPLYACQNYTPKFGHSQQQGLTLNGFLKLYGEDPFYSWIGLNTEQIYLAHKAAGSMTSIYRQLGIGCERLFRLILCDMAQYDNLNSAKWGYSTKTKAGKEKTLSLDGRLELNGQQNHAVKDNVQNWIKEYSKRLNVPSPQNGAVFEVRQGYKSKDSKRQNADIDNATVAWASQYLPVFTIFSSQIDDDIVNRYLNNRCGILLGREGDDPCTSLYAFCREIYIMIWLISSNEIHQQLLKNYTQY